MGKYVSRYVMQCALGYSHSELSNIFKESNVENKYNVKENSKMQKI